MREPLKDRERLEHMLMAIDRILRYTKGKTFQASHPDTPWKMVKGMRNYIVHEYFQIDNVVVWDVVTNELATLREQISRYVTETNWKQWEK